MGTSAATVKGHAAPRVAPDRVAALYAAHGPAVLAYACRRTDPDTAQDVLGEVFLVVARRPEDVPGDALPWLYGVAGNVLRNEARAARRRAALAARAAREPVAFVHPPALPDRPLGRALATLGAADREALLLTAWEGLDTARAAHAVGCSRATFLVRLHRARRRLAAALAAQDGPTTTGDDHATR
jgi:RNA polymerase sigma factor (sigma-70 family)